uniref:Uncharacterized protein n=1 Tax=Opuntia streptacantha TaxID=393608 RepID=A0A7C8YY70_OPUST
MLGHISLSSSTDAIDGLLAYASHGCLRAIYLNWNSNLLSEHSHFCQTLLVIWTSSPHINVHSSSFKLSFLLFKSLDNSIEGGSNISEIGNASSNDEGSLTPIRVCRCTINHNSGILQHLLFFGCTTIFSIVSKL